MKTYSIKYLVWDDKLKAMIEVDYPCRSVLTATTTSSSWIPDEKHQCQDRPGDYSLLRERIAKLEGENETLRKQLRSREINAEPVPKPVRYRWGHPV